MPAKAALALLLFARAVVADGTPTGGTWDWTLSFNMPPYNQNNYVNTAATLESTITGGNYSAILAGSENWVEADYTVIAGGALNTATGNAATVRGGLRNTAKGDYSTVVGGAVNKVHSNYGTVLGGFKNTVKGRFGTVLGGARNTASGRFTVVAGVNAKATDDYSAVLNFNDDTVYDVNCESMGPNTVRFCAQRILFGDSDTPEDMLDLLNDLSSMPALPARNLNQEVETTDLLSQRLDALAAKVATQAEMMLELRSKVSP